MFGGIVSALASPIAGALGSFGLDQIGNEMNARRAHRYNKKHFRFLQGMGLTPQEIMGGGGGSGGASGGSIGNGNNVMMAAQQQFEAEQRQADREKDIRIAEIQADTGRAGQQARLLSDREGRITQEMIAIMQNATARRGQDVGAEVRRWATQQDNDTRRYVAALDQHIRAAKLDIDRDTLALAKEQWQTQKWSHEKSWVIYKTMLSMGPQNVLQAILLQQFEAATGHTALTQGGKLIPWKEFDRLISSLTAANSSALNHLNALGGYIFGTNDFKMTDDKPTRLRLQDSRFR